MKEIIVYESYGKRFDKKEDAMAYEKLHEEVDELMAAMAPRTQLVEDGLECIRHCADTVKACFKIFCDICKNAIPLHQRIFDEVREGVRHRSHAEYILSDYSQDFPVLRDTLYRFACIDFETGLEFQQPYFVKNQEEYFEIIEKYKSHKTE